MLENVEQKLLAPDNSIAAIVSPEKVEFPEGSYFNQKISSLDVTEFNREQFGDCRIVTDKDKKQFRNAFLLEVERRFLQQGYRWEE